MNTLNEALDAARKAGARFVAGTTQRTPIDDFAPAGSKLHEVPWRFLSRIAFCRCRPEHSLASLPLDVVGALAALDAGGIVLDAKGISAVFPCYLTGAADVLGSLTPQNALAMRCLARGDGIGTDHVNDLVEAGLVKRSIDPYRPTFVARGEEILVVLSEVLA